MKKTFIGIFQLKTHLFRDPFRFVPFVNGLLRWMNSVFYFIISAAAAFNLASSA